MTETRETAGGGVDPGEVARFGAIAEEWWDPKGRFRPLHAMNPVRLDYIADQLAAEHGRDRRALRPFEGLAVLDIGCGGGLVSEPLARLGASVTGIDPSEETIGVARAHAAAQGLAIDYRATTAEALRDAGARFDAVVAMEVVEHVPDRPAFLATVADLARPGAPVVLSTLNRTAKSWAVAIVGAEYVLGWLPRGTHDWRRFPTPGELGREIEGAGLVEVDRRGMVYDPLAGTWGLSSRDLAVNYIVTAMKDTEEKTR